MMIFCLFVVVFFSFMFFVTTIYHINKIFLYFYPATNLQNGHFSFLIISLTGQRHASSVNFLYYESFKDTVLNKGENYLCFDALDNISAP